MTSQDLGFDDIFRGSEEVEILGKLPAFLWAYIDNARRLVQDLGAKPADYSESVLKVEKVLGILNSAADHLGNQDLKDRLSPQSEMLQALTVEGLTDRKIVDSFTAGLLSLEEIAGQRPASVRDSFLDKVVLEQELDKVEKIKTGRSADIIVSVDILNDVRSYLTKEIMIEGISALMIIDTAGSLILHIGNKIELDAVSLAAVAAANFAATEQIARLIGEQDFVLLFYKGHNESFHFSRVGPEYIIVTIFNNSLSLGLLRLRIAEVVLVLEKKLPKREA
jgi:predicted regulator of Ras-like GTPase activity (Roadblock/LC7/MglB family)